MSNHGGFIDGGGGGFREEDHPRGQGGKFAGKPGGGAGHAPGAGQPQSAGSEGAEKVPSSDSWAQAQYGDWAAKLPEDQASALRAYKTQYYAAINGALRDRPGGTPAARAEAAQLVPLIDAAIASAPPTDQPQTVYRAFVSDRVAKAGAKLKGATVQDDGFASTTLDKRVHDQFMAQAEDKWIHGEGERPVSAEIRIPKGAKVAGLDQVFHLSEGELLVPRGAKFKVSAVEKHASRYGPVRMKMELQHGG